MKHLLVSLLCLALCLPMAGHGRIKVACVGNSVTYGYGLKDRAHDAYPVRLQTMLGDKYEVRNFGHSGATLLFHGHNPYVKLQEFRAALDTMPMNLSPTTARSSTPSAWPTRKPKSGFA